MKNKKVKLLPIKTAQVTLPDGVAFTILYQQFADGKIAHYAMIECGQKK